MSDYILHINERVNIRPSANAVRPALPKILDDIYPQHISGLKKLIYTSGAIIFNDKTAGVIYPTYHSEIIDHHEIHYCLCSVTTQVEGYESFWETFICDPDELDYPENYQ